MGARCQHQRHRRYRPVISEVDIRDLVGSGAFAFLATLAHYVLAATISLELQKWGRPPTLPRSLRTMMLALLITPLLLDGAIPATPPLALLLGCAFAAGVMLRALTAPIEILVAGINDAARPLAVSSGSDVPSEALHVFVYAMLWPLLLASFMNASILVGDTITAAERGAEPAAAERLLVGAQQQLVAALSDGFGLLVTFVAWVLALELAAGLLQRAMPSLPVLFMLMPVRMLGLLVALLLALPRVIERLFDV